MSITTPKEITRDWRNLANEDDSANRKIAMRNLERQEKENEPQWKERQKKLYATALDVSPDLNLGDIIKKEGLLVDDPNNNRAKVLTELGKITDKSIAEYIVDRLSPEELLYLMVNFKGIVRNIKKNQSSLDKDMFINMVKQLTVERPLVLGDAADLSEEAKTREGISHQEGLQRKSQLDRSDSKYQGREKAAQREDERRKEKERRDQPEVSQIFESAEQQIQESISRENKRWSNRLRRQNDSDQLLITRQDSAPVTAGAYSTSIVNPSTPQNVRVADALESATLDLSPARLMNIYGASPPVTRRLRGRPRENREQQHQQQQQGRGVRRMIEGRGVTLQSKSERNRHYIGIFYVEKHKLNDENLLSVKYSRTDSPVQKMRNIRISDDLKQIVNDVLGNCYNKRLYDQLNANDKRLFHQFVEVLRLTDEIPIDDTIDKDFLKNYQTLLGQFQSGNDSPEIKAALKQHVIQGLGLGQINKNEAYFLLYQLSL